MGINKDSNGFTFGFAIAMVVVVGVVLAVTAMGLKPFQQENVQQEKMQDILSAVNVNVSRDEAKTKFYDYVVERVALDYQGNITKEKDGQIITLDEGQEAFESDPFNIDVKKEYRGLPPEKRSYPMYICEKDDERFYVIPLVGKGLWGPIWGFVSLYGDGETIYGANFDHKSETPGLGAEISLPSFEEKFEQRSIFDESGEFASVRVVKAGKAGNDPHKVDGITGGTITSEGVDKMLKRTLQIYIPYFENNKKS